MMRRRSRRDRSAGRWGIGALGTVLVAGMLMAPEALAANAQPRANGADPNGQEASGEETNGHDANGEDASGAEEKTRSFELSALVATSIVLQDVAYPDQATGNRPVGFGGSLALSFKTPYFLFPFVDVSYFDLARASGPALLVPGTPIVHNALAGWFSYVGAGVDLWRFRVAAGVGLDFLTRSSVTGTVQNEVTSIGLSSMVALGFRLVERRRFAMAAQGRFYSAPASGDSFYAVGLSLHGDVLTF